jgi:hypothetical protein
LKHRALRCAADQMLQRKNLGDLLEHPRDAPTLQVDLQNVVRKIRVGVQQIREQHQRFFPRPFQGQPTHKATVAILGATQPTPAFFITTAATVAPRPGRAAGIDHELALSATAAMFEEGIAAEGDQGGKREFAFVGLAAMAVKEMIEGIGRGGVPCQQQDGFGKRQALQDVMVKGRGRLSRHRRSQGKSSGKCSCAIADVS